MNFHSILTKKTSQLTNIIDDGKQINVSFHYYNRNINSFINSLFSKILSRKNIPFLHSTVTTILRELITNAIKANSKRVYFKSNNLDMFDDKEYNAGMENFKSYIVSNQEEVEEELKKFNLKVTMQINNSERGLKIMIINNVPLHREELSKIQHRIQKAGEFKDFSEVYSEVIDSSEGEGLGIILTMLFLRNSGIGEQSFKISADSEKTYTSLIIPFDLSPVEITSKIQDGIFKEIEELPTFPENILELQKLCKTEDVTLKKISDRISLNPSLSVSVLKLANSAGFLTRNRTEYVIDAIKIIGLKNLEALLITSSARKIMNEKYTVFKKIWDHCNKTSAYARYIAMKFGYAVLSDSAALGGLLHDLGKIILLSANSALSEWISEITRKKELRTSTTLEEVSIGLSHSTIGELIAAKWNLPEYIIESIKNHHSPLNCSAQYREIVYIIYLGNHLCNIEDKVSQYYFIEQEVLDMFKINDEEELMKLHSEIKTMQVIESKYN